MNIELKEKIRKLIEGEALDDMKTLTDYSHDNSVLVVRPKLVVFPKNTEDIKKLVTFVNEHRKEDPSLSLTVRAAGSCMSGGPINESIIVDVSKYFDHFEIDPQTQMAVVEPGVFYRNFEVETLKHELILPCYTASKNLCALGGMIGNNCAGEKTLQYGKMENYVEELTVVLRDGKEHVFRAVSKAEALKKAHEQGIEGSIYEHMSRLVEENKQLLNDEKPHVSKNSAGYYLWNISHDDLFDLNKLFVGSQGTLGIVTRAKVRLVPTKKHSKLFVIFMKDLGNLGQIVNVILSKKPESVESYDDATWKLAIKFFPEMLGLMKVKNMMKLAWSFLPEMRMILSSGFPKLILLVEFAGNSEEEIEREMTDLEVGLRDFGLTMRKTKSMEEADKYWTIRRESFNLLRKHIRGKRTAPFIDDICVRPEFLPEFLPKLQKILNDGKLLCTVAGHAGNGNFHIIPLMDLRKEKERAKIPVISEKVYDLVHEYEGTITAEHNDGLIRTPYLNKMFSGRMLALFAETKHIFDPDNIFNPNKKVGASVQYLIDHLAKA